MFMSLSQYTSMPTTSMKFNGAVKSVTDITKADRQNILEEARRRPLPENDLGEKNKQTKKQHKAAGFPLTAHVRTSKHI